MTIARIASRAQQDPDRRNVDFNDARFADVEAEIEGGLRGRCYFSGPRHVPSASSAELDTVAANKTCHS